MPPRLIRFSELAASLIITLSRRQFLQNLAAASAVAILPRSVGRSDPPPRASDAPSVDASPAKAAAHSFSLLSYNILYDSPKWGADYAWTKRQSGVMEILHRHAPDLIGLQEVATGQLLSFQQALPEYGLTGNAPGRAADARYPWLMNPIFFRLDRFQLLESGFVWLGAVDGQGRPQFGWPDENLPAVRLHYAPWVKLCDISSGCVFCYINVHLPPEAPVLRTRSAEILLKLVRQFARDIPVCLAGDCNASNEPAIEAICRGGFRDARTASLAPAQGPASTKVNRRTQKLEPAAPIDHVFAGPGFRLESFAILDEQIGGRYPSDHLPVLARLTPVATG